MPKLVMVIDPERPHSASTDAQRMSLVELERTVVLVARDALRPPAAQSISLEKDEGLNALRLVVTGDDDLMLRAGLEQIARDHRLTHVSFSILDLSHEEEPENAGSFTESPVAVAAPSLRLWIDPGDASSDVVADLLRALSDLHQAAGGSGLRFAVDGEETLTVVEDHA